MVENEKVTFADADENFFAIASSEEAKIDLGKEGAGSPTGT